MKEGETISIPFKVDRVREGHFDEYAQLHYKKHNLIILTKDLEDLREK